MTEKFKVPHFASEAEETQWWYEHRDDLTKAFERAAKRGELRMSSASQLMPARSAGATPTTTIRLDPDDISRARPWLPNADSAIRPISRCYCTRHWKQMRRRSPASVLKFTQLGILAHCRMVSLT
jgi:hypothetical protein